MAQSCWSPFFGVDHVDYVGHVEHVDHVDHVDYVDGTLECCMPSSRERFWRFLGVQGAVWVSWLGWPFLQLLDIHLFIHDDDDGDDDYYYHSEYIVIGVSPV